VTPTHFRFYLSRPFFVSEVWLTVKRYPLTGMRKQKNLRDA
jgi:hypothetical protein